MRGLWWAVGFGVSWVGMGADVAPTARTIFMRPRRAGDASRPHRGCASAWIGAGAHSVPSWRRVLRWAPRAHDSFVCLFGHYASRVSLGVRMALSVPDGTGRPGRHRAAPGVGRHRARGPVPGKRCVSRQVPHCSRGMWSPGRAALRGFRCRPPRPRTLGRPKSNEETRRRDIGRAEPWGEQCHVRPRATARDTWTPRGIDVLPGTGVPGRERNGSGDRRAVNRTRLVRPRSTGRRTAGRHRPGRPGRPWRFRRPCRRCAGRRPS